MSKLIKLIISPSYYLYSILKFDYSTNYETLIKQKEFNRILADNVKNFYLMVVLNTLLVINVNEIYEGRNYMSRYNMFFSLLICCVLIFLTFKFSNRIYFVEDYGTNIEFSIVQKVYLFIMKKGNVLNIFIILLFLLITVLSKNYRGFFTDIIIYLLIYYYGLSRISHLFLVFVDDIFKDKEKDDLFKNEPYDKSYIKANRKAYIVIMSYISIALEYSVLYYILNSKYGMFSNSFSNWFESFYYSIATITTLGYGDYYPTNNLSQLYVIIQIISGMFLLVFTLVRYMNEE